MRKILLFLLFFIYSNHLYSKEVTVKGYPTSVQINDNKTLTLMVNDDYKFSFFCIVYDGKIRINQLTGLTKKDVVDNSSDLNNKFAQICSEDKQMLLEIKKEKEKQQSRISKKRGLDVSLYVYVCYYKKTDNRTICILNIEDGDYVYDSIKITINNGKTRIESIKKGIVVCCCNMEYNKSILVSYNFNKDKTYISILN